MQPANWILWHNCNTFSVDGIQVGVLEQTNQVSLGCLLKSHNSRTLEPQISFEILGNLMDKMLEGSLRMRSSVNLWYLLISQRASVPGL